MKNVGFDRQWPPEYQVRVSQRAKRINLTISPKKGLEIILPVGADSSEIPAVLAEKRHWILRHLNHIAQRQDKPDDILPEKIMLRAIEEEWTVVYLENSERAKLFPRGNCELAILGKLDPATVHSLLQKWLHNKAKKILIPMLQQLSEEYQLPFTKVTIRGQKQRWGSCNYAKHISLNYKLLLLPPEYVQHILLHELCHTVHLNHSAQFYQLLERLDPQTPRLNKLTKRAHEFMPGWVE